MTARGAGAAWLRCPPLPARTSDVAHVARLLLALTVSAVLASGLAACGNSRVSADDAPRSAPPLAPLRNSSPPPLPPAGATTSTPGGTGSTPTSTPTSTAPAATPSTSPSTPTTPTGTPAPGTATTPASTGGAAPPTGDAGRGRYCRANPGAC